VTAINLHIIHRDFLLPALLQRAERRFYVAASGVTTDGAR
jgi:hypothetical protein